MNTDESLIEWLARKADDLDDAAAHGDEEIVRVEAQLADHRERVEWLRGRAAEIRRAIEALKP